MGLCVVTTNLDIGEIFANPETNACLPIGMEMSRDFIDEDYTRGDDFDGVVFSLSKKCRNSRVRANIDL